MHAFSFRHPLDRAKNFLQILQYLAWCQIVLGLHTLHAYYMSDSGNLNVIRNEEERQFVKNWHEQTVHTAGFWGIGLGLAVLVFATYTRKALRQLPVTDPK